MLKLAYVGPHSSYLKKYPFSLPGFRTLVLAALGTRSVASVSSAVPSSRHGCSAVDLGVSNAMNRPKEKSLIERRTYQEIT